MEVGLRDCSEREVGRPVRSGELGGRGGMDYTDQAPLYSVRALHFGREFA